MQVQIEGVLFLYCNAHTHSSTYTYSLCLRMDMCVQDVIDSHKHTQNTDTVWDTQSGILIWIHSLPPPPQTHTHSLGMGGVYSLRCLVRSENCDASKLRQVFTKQLFWWFFSLSVFDLMQLTPSSAGPHVSPVHGSVEDTKLSTNKQHSLSEPGLHVSPVQG